MDPLTLGMIVLVVAATNLLMRRAFPRRGGLPPAAVLGAQAARFRPWVWKYYALFAGASVIGAGLSWAALLGVARLRYSVLSPAQVAIMLPPIAWAVPALFLGLVTAGWLVDHLVRRSLGAEYGDFLAYLAYLSVRQGMDVARLNRWSSRVVTPLFLVFVGSAVVLLLDYYVLATPDVLIIDGFWSLEPRQYRYADVADIVRAHGVEGRSGEIQYWDHPLYEIQFLNGERWSTRWVAGELTEAGDGLIVAVARHAALPIRDDEAYRPRVARQPWPTRIGPECDSVAARAPSAGESTKVIPPVVRYSWFMRSHPREWEGRTVEVTFAVDRRGHPDLERTTFSEPLPPSDADTMLSALGRWRFIPAIREGCAAPGSTIVRMEFQRPVPRLR